MDKILKKLKKSEISELLLSPIRDNKRILGWSDRLNNWISDISKIDSSIFNRLDIESEVLRIEDSITKKVIAYMVTNKVGEYDIYEFYVSKYCLAYRPRPDGYIGFQALNGGDTRLSLHKRDKKVIDEINIKRGDYIKDQIKKRLRTESAKIDEKLSKVARAKVIKKLEKDIKVIIEEETKLSIIDSIDTDWNNKKSVFRIKE